MAEPILNEQGVNPIALATAQTPTTMTTTAPQVAPVAVPPVGSFNAGTPAQVTTTSNIAASAQPAPAPNDLLGIRNQINQQLGVTQAQSAYDAAYNALSQHDLGTTTLSSQIANQPVAMNVLRGEQGVAAEQRAIQRQALAMTANVEANKLQALQQEAAQQFAIKQQNVQEMKSLIVQYPGAGITFADSTEQAAAKIAKWNRDEEKRLKKQAQKDAKKSSKAEYKMWLKKTEKTNELSYADWKRKGGGGGGKTDTLSADIANMSANLAGRVGPDGRISENDFNLAKRKWTAAGNKASDFDANFANMINPAYVSTYNLDKQPTQ